MTMMISFDEMSKQVWATSDVDQKKALLNQMVDTFKFKGKGQAHVKNFKADIAKQTSGQKLDMIAANLALNITDKVVKI